MAIDYQVLIDEAMIGIVKKVLADVRDNGLYANQSFYISFRTDFPDVKLSKNIKQRYPKEITIVIQHQYRDLVVHDKVFSVNLAFGGLPETIEVPFASLTNFVDSSVDFSLQFRHSEEQIENSFIESDEGDQDIVNIKDISVKTNNTQDHIKDKTRGTGEVISLDKFRRKNNL